RKPGSCGRAAPGVELAILDDDGRRAAPGTPGELFVRRYEGVFDEYYGNPTATAQTSRGEWMSVGDVAWMDDEGFVYICDRKRDMIISGGVNIYPAEIEDALHRHPAVEDAAVFGVPDAEWGERVHAATQLRPGERVTERELMDFRRAGTGGARRLARPGARVAAAGAVVAVGAVHGAAPGVSSSGRAANAGSWRARRRPEPGGRRPRTGAAPPTSAPA